jgi:hypothetical protein
MSTLEEVARFPTMSEASVAQSFLRAHGIEAVLAEANMYGALPIRLSRGGFRIMAPRQEVHAARTLLADIQGQENQHDDDPPV